ncbi:MAG: hypothetical protein IE909_07335 [Campylobacterales bacterium]|nr:hypothetical protein [Campylobacterales bacterium]
MELLSVFVIVFFIVALNEIRVAFLGEKNSFSIGAIAFSSFIAGILFAMIASA